MSETLIICIITLVYILMMHALQVVLDRLHRKKVALLEAEIERLRDELAWYRSTGGSGTNTVGEVLQPRTGGQCLTNFTVPMPPKEDE